MILKELQKKASQFDIPWWFYAEYIKTHLTHIKLNDIEDLTEEILEAYLLNENEVPEKRLIGE